MKILTRNIIENILLLDKNINNRINIDDMFDYVYNSFDNFLSAKEFNICDEILNSLADKKLNHNTMVAILIITSNYKEHLINRNNFYNNCHKYISSIFSKKETKKILQNLK